MTHAAWWEGVRLAFAAIVGWISRHITYRNGRG
jgi:hypothetical protein